MGNAHKILTEKSRQQKSINNIILIENYIIWFVKEKTIGPQMAAFVLKSMIPSLD